MRHTHRPFVLMTRSGHSKRPKDPAVVGGERPYPALAPAAKWRRQAVVAGVRGGGSCACCSGWRRGGAVGAKERTVTLDFGCDESRDPPDMRGSSVIFVNVHLKGQ